MSTALAALHAALRRCRLCPEAGHAVAPPAVFSGHSSAEVMTIGQAPGVTETAVGRPFNGSSGRRLFAWLAEVGWDEADFRSRQYMTSVTKCYPGKQPNGKGDRAPSRAEQTLCRPYLAQELALVQPRVIIPIGGLAVRLFFPAAMPLQTVIGRALYLSAAQLADRDPFDMRDAQLVEQPLSEVGGRYIVPLPHPSGASLWHNQPAHRELIARALAFLRALRAQRHIP